MKRNLSSFALALTVLASTLVLMQCNSSGGIDRRRSAVERPASSEPQSANSTVRVPAHCETRPSLASLGPTLPPERFHGQTRAAYQAVKEMPQTIAQLPCYCHCDRGMGHKSLHTCFEDDHATHCAVCVNEALMAYRLEKEESLDAAQIRQRIIAEYSRQ